MYKLLATSLLTSSLFLTGWIGIANAAENGSRENAVVVTVDQAKVFRVSRPAATIIVGNPAIVDATVEDERTLVLTGRSFGVTNLIVLDIDGDAVVDQHVVVTGSETNTVRIYRRESRETLACAPVCEPTLTIGDDNAAFNFASTQIETRNQLSEANSD
ncbi:MAG: pilus assembly protein N-terminal domain-containing protein [Pseudomonadota bacterium]